MRDAEQMLRQMHKDPREITLICSLIERHRVQHEQIMACAQTINGLQNLLSQLIMKMGIRDDNLKKLGVEEMLKGNMSDMVQSVDANDGDPDDTQTKLRGH